MGKLFTQFHTSVDTSRYLPTSGLRNNLYQKNRPFGCKTHGFPSIFPSMFPISSHLKPGRRGHIPCGADAIGTACGDLSSIWSGQWPEGTFQKLMSEAKSVNLSGGWFVPLKSTTGAMSSSLAPAVAIGGYGDAISLAGHRGWRFKNEPLDGFSARVLG
jgi:hypothetical protein